MFNERLREARKKAGLTQKDVASQLNMTEAGYCGHETGKRVPNALQIARIAKIIGVTGDYLLETEQLSAGDMVPLLGRIACGAPILADENIEEYISLPSGVRADYALRCVGDSMIGAGIQDGDTVFIRADASVENGQIAAVRRPDWQPLALRPLVDALSVVANQVSELAPEQPPSVQNGLQPLRKNLLVCCQCSMPPVSESPKIQSADTPSA